MSLPHGWFRDFLDRADLDASFAALEGHTCAHSEMMRGRIRSLQLRPHEAQERFEQAEQLFPDQDVNLSNLCPRFALQIYTLENSLLLAKPASRTEDAAGRFDWPSAVPLTDSSELQRVITLSKWAYGLVSLHLGDWQDAEGFLSALVEESDTTAWSSLFSIALAFSQLNQARLDAAARTIERASRALASAPSLERVHATAALHALAEYLGDEAETRSWRRKLMDLPVPRSTRDFFGARAKLICARSRQVGGLVFL